MSDHLAPLLVRYIREVSQARRQRDLAIELLLVASEYIGRLESNRRLQTEFDDAMARIDFDCERRREKAAA